MNEENEWNRNSKEMNPNFNTLETESLGNLWGDGLVRTISLSQNTSPTLSNNQVEKGFVVEFPCDSGTVAQTVIKERYDDTNGDSITNPGQKDLSDLNTPTETIESSKTLQPIDIPTQSTHREVITMDAHPVSEPVSGSERLSGSWKSISSARKLRSSISKSQEKFTSKSQTLSQIQSIFNDSQKIAYVGLCYLSISDFKSKMLKDQKKASASYDKWSTAFMEKLYVYLDLSPAERLMIEQLADHGLLPSDLSSSLLNDAKMAAESFQKNVDGEEASDIRYTVLSHMFLLSISDGYYDSRSRAVLCTVAKHLEIPYLDVVRLETLIANELRIYDEPEEVKPDEQIVGERNKVEGKNRWIYAGVATVAGGAIIGLTAGLAAPFIGAGIGAALTTFGVTNGAAGIGAFMASTGGLALITSGGVLTGGGMSGLKMMKRTRGIEEFEFIGLSDALLAIKEHKEKRYKERYQTKEDEKNEKLEHELSDHLRTSSSLSETTMPVKKRTNEKLAVEDVLWEVKSNISDEAKHDTNQEVGEHVLDTWANPNGDDIEVDDNAKNILSSSNTEQNSNISRQTNVLITVSGWVAYDRDDHTYPFSVLEEGLNGDQYTLIWETRVLQELGSHLSILFGEIASFIFQQGLQATLLPVLMGALTGPLWLMKLTYLVDNPWGNALSKAEKAGRLLADTLIGQVQSNRPVTLVGFSAGARLIYYCLLELAKKGAYGIIESAYIFGTPCVSSKKEWEQISSVVSGKVYNGYTTNDMLLGVLYRATTSSYKDVPGLSPIEGFSGVENVNLTDLVNGHMEYQSKLPIILKHVGFQINSETFEDQDAEAIRYRAEQEELKNQLKEKRQQEKEEFQKKKQEEKAAEIEKKKLAKEAELERLRLSKEAELAEKKRAEAAKRAAESQPKSLTHVSSQDELVTDELQQMAEMEQMMSMYWQPREIISTLPPLVIETKDHGEVQNPEEEQLSPF